ncbi:MAG: DUF4832 domain-containing protein [Candidatus Pseudobacter hemicellulosilyticus]|uniref:DUF4832 domain-containing protein n=1 Tax=Candidatus Pseudobacter hemicellulosilyticus TaxID=3121375 RepID=A0AAJ5WUK6_9BACT|nr:MAG: DUF4832 domain-containing protein [Pseudobacter sp.]
MYKSFLLLLLAFVSINSNCSRSNDSGKQEPVDSSFTYEQSAALFPNPERGFIRTIQVKSGGAGLDVSLLNTLRSSNTSMILRVYYFDGFKDKALDAATLQLIQDDFNKIRAAGLKMILRFAYTDDMAVTDAPLNIIEQHIDQLKPLFGTNQDVIAFVQAGFIGAWGEWHSSGSGLANTEGRTAVLNKLLAALPSSIMVQVRTPLYKQQILNTASALTETEAYGNTTKARVGHHNDCFLSNSTDYGTYTNVTLEKQYISNEALYVPTGGETCPPTDGFNPGCATSTSEMKLLKWTYLNLDWYPATINAWKNSGCFDEFQRSLGYRLALWNSTLPAEASAAGSLKLTFSIINKGFAPLYHKKNTLLVLKDKVSGQYYDKPLSIDLRTVKPSATLEIAETVSLSGIPAGNYELYLKIADQSASLSNKSQYSVRLANTDTWTEDHGGLNSFKHTLTVK